MDAATIAALDRLNRSFYEARAEEFSATRGRPWAGWRRLLAPLGALAAERPLRILDLGSGNGRFRLWLEGDRDAPAFQYVGIERVADLIAQAARRCGRGGWIEADPVAAKGRLPVSPGTIDAAVAMGFLHHVPAFDLRCRIVAEMVDCLRAGGLLILTHWQFADKPRFRKRLIPWQEHDRHLSEAIDLRQLEEGDHLLAWGETPARGPGAARYCHHTSRREAQRLVAGLPVRTVETFLADGASGDLNSYCVLSKLH